MQTSPLLIYVKAKPFHFSISHFPFLTSITFFILSLISPSHTHPSETSLEESKAENFMGLNIFISSSVGISKTTCVLPIKKTSRQTHGLKRQNWDLQYYMLFHSHLSGEYVSILMHNQRHNTTSVSGRPCFSVQ